MKRPRVDPRIAAEIDKNEKYLVSLGISMEKQLLRRDKIGHSPTEILNDQKKMIVTGEARQAKKGSQQ